MNAKTYRVISGPNITSLESEVNSAIESGGELVGGVSCYCYGQVGYREFGFYQAMMIPVETKRQGN